MKRFLLLLTVICLSICGFVNAQIPQAKAFASDSIVKTGNSFVMTVEINKCDLSCYAQFQMLLPEGLSATEISGESDNANFYFENNKVFYQWYKLPIERSNIRLKFNVAVSQGMKVGGYEIPGYFSYQVNNRLGQIETPVKIQIQ